MLSRFLFFLLLPLPLLSLEAEEYVRVYTMGRNEEGKLMRVIDQPVFLWKDSSTLRQDIKAGARAVRMDGSLSLDANEQLKVFLNEMPKPDSESRTDINGQALLTGVDIGRRYLVIVMNNIPYHRGGGPFVGIKQPGSRRVRCSGVDLNGLLTFLERFQRRPVANVLE